MVGIGEGGKGSILKGAGGLTVEVGGGEVPTYRRVWGG